MTQPRHPDAILVALDEIEVPEQFRKPDPGKVNELSQSIATDGLLHPIGLRKGANKPYELVYGGHRLASHRRLGLAEIEARLLALDETESESAALAENLFRSALEPVDAIAALKRWRELYKARHPEAMGSAALSAAGKKRHVAPAPADGDPALCNLHKAEADDGPGPEADDEPAAPTRIDVAAANTLGVKPAHARKLLKTAKILDEGDLKILKLRGLNHAELETLARIKDEKARKRTIALVAGGMDLEPAIAYGTAPPNATLQAIEAADSGVKPESDMTDDEWLEHYCPDILARLTYQVTFRRDAIVWRKLYPLLAEVRKKGKKPLSRAKTGRIGPYHYKATSFLEVLHPNDWAACGPCGGTGQDGNVSQCTACHGDGYSVVIGRAR